MYNESHEFGYHGKQQNTLLDVKPIENNINNNNNNEIDDE